MELVAVRRILDSIRNYLGIRVGISDICHQRVGIWDRIRVIHGV